MNVNHYVGFDVHKKSVGYCVKAADGENPGGKPVSLNCVISLGFGNGVTALNS